ncbi:putative boron transporter 4-like [Capsicum annuum]|uniref:mavicyanin-like n=1 Tax=Capsicum annuum TaxID=4072 RepID=UPI001FB0B056|nr:mavicyanin-like [Capsicum annuum]KAF3673904.1 putative boron transporter 4-like [Capsicum annuum]KAF3676601.1 putative boron transporter 4-like [Capsicum annuum]
MTSSKSLLYLVFFLSLHFFSGFSTEFTVGGDEGWVIPKDDQLYNQWASKNRFKVNDTLLFAYKKDSVMAVTQEEYEKCKSVHPVYFSNNGKSIFKLDRPGLFYFISGVSGHCERGLKMIVKVLEPASPPQVASETSGPPTSGATKSAKVVVVFVVSLFGVMFV